MNYVHPTEIQQAEAPGVKATGTQIEKQKNLSTVDIGINVHELDITHSSLISRQNKNLKLSALFK